MSQTYSTREVHWRTGASLRQLQYWDETGILVPLHVRHKRQYTAEQIVQARLILAILYRNPRSVIPRRLVRAIPEDAQYLVMNTEKLFLWAQDREQVIRICKTVAGGLFVIDIEEVKRGKPKAKGAGV